MDAIAELKAWKIKIDAELEAYFKEKLNAAENISYAAKDMLQKIKEICMRGGKRIRPALMIMGYKAFGGKNEKAILKASIAIELMHLALILQDDIMDDSDERHSGPTLYKVYGKEKRKLGENLANCGVDLIFALSYKALEESNFDSELKLKTISKMSQILFNTGTGQILDIVQAEMKLTEIKEDDITEMHLLKTAKYSFEGPLHLGGILAGADDDKLFRLSEYAIPLGQAFQIRDDILGMFASSQKLGKSADSDLKEGKRTILMLKAYEHASPEVKAYLLSTLGDKKSNKEDMEKMRDLIRSTGALEYSQELANKLAERAKNKLVKCEIDNYVREFLEGIADYMTKREY